jgi:hypothetical protein
LHRIRKETPAGKARPKKWAGCLKLTKASLYTHITIQFGVGGKKYNIPLENWRRPGE